MGFLAPSLLFLTSFALIPLIIHLIQRIRLKKITYSSLFFLTETKRETFTWLHLKEILLLIFRTLFIFFLLFSLARPYLFRRIDTGKIEASRIILLDNSLSMGYAENFTRAKNQARNLIQVLKKNSEVALLTSDGKIRTGFTSDFGVVQKLLDTLFVSYDHRPLASAYEHGIKLLNNARYANKDIYIITDLQNYALQPLMKIIDNDSAVSSKLRTDLTIIDIGSTHPGNVSIEQAYTIPKFPSSDVVTRVYIKTKNHTGYSQSRTLSAVLQRTDNDSVLYRGQKSVEFNPHEQKLIPLDVEINRAGIYTVQASLNFDSLSLDDQYYFTVNIQEKKKILLITDKEESARYLEKALATASFGVTVGNIKSLYEQNLKQYGAIGLINPSQFAAMDFERIASYLKTGGGVFILVNQEIREPRWNQILNLGFGCDGKTVTLGAGSFTSIKNVKYENPIAEILQDFSLSSVRFFSYWQTEQIPTNQIIITFTNQSPFLAQSTNQKIILAFTSFDNTSTDLVYKTAFAPLMHQVFSYLSTPLLTTNYFVNDTIILELPAQIPVKIRTPVSEYLQTPQNQNNRFFLRFTDTQQPGIYELSNNLVTVNIFPEESDLSRVSDPQLKSRHIKVIHGDGHKSSDFTQFSLLLALLFIIGELILLVF